MDCDGEAAALWPEGAEYGTLRVILERKRAGWVAIVAAWNTELIVANLSSYSSNSMGDVSRAGDTCARALY